MTSKKSKKTKKFRTKADKIAEPMVKKRGVIPDFFRKPYHIAFDTIFYKHFVANKVSVIEEVRELIGGDFEFHYTPCVLFSISNYRFRSDRAFDYVTFKEVRCRDLVSYRGTEFSCLVNFLQEEKDLILATGDNRLQGLCRKVTRAPIIFLEDGALSFEGLHENRYVVTEHKQSIRPVGASASTLYVGNLAWKIDDDWLKRIFKGCGHVISATVKCDQTTGLSRGFGYVTMASMAEMNKAINRFDKKVVCGRKISVNVANDCPNNGSSSKRKYHLISASGAAVDSKKVKTEREREPLKDMLVSAAKNGKVVEGSSSSKQAACRASFTGSVTKNESGAVLMHKAPVTPNDPFAKFKSRLSTKKNEDEGSSGTPSLSKSSKRKRKSSDYAKSASCAAVASKEVKTVNETKPVKDKLASAAMNGVAVKGSSSSKPDTAPVSSTGRVTEDEVVDKFQSRLLTKEVPDASSRIIRGGFGSFTSGFGGSNRYRGGRTGGGRFGSGVGRSSGYGGSGGGFGSSSSSYGGDRTGGGCFGSGGGRSSGYGGTGGRLGSGGGRSSDYG